MRARYKGPEGTGVLTLDDDATVGQLFDAVREKSGIKSFSLKYGWPLKTLEEGQKGEVAKTLGLNGETLTIVPDESSVPAPAPAPAPKASYSTAASSGTAGGSSFSGSAFKPQAPTQGPEAVAIPWPAREGTLLLRVMPDDNSCLFTAFGGALPRQPPASELRRLVGEYILTHQDEYNEAILSMPPTDYANKMQDRDRWGGAIELAVLSRLFDVEIATLDVKSGQLYRFGEDKQDRCVLVYSGIHYDRVALSPSEPPYESSDLPPELDRALWPTDDHEVLDFANRLVKRLNEMHYYTDPSEILLRCGVPGCEWLGSGERAGALHAQQTGHAALEEIEDSALLKCNTPGCDWLGSGESEAKKHTSDSGHSSLSVIPDF